MELKKIWINKKRQPSRAEAAIECADKGRYVALSPAIFEGWHVWIVPKKELKLTHPN